MPIYEFTQTGINRLDETTFSLVDMQERRDLQRLLRENVEVITPDTLLIAEEFGDWDDLEGASICSPSTGPLILS